MRRLLNSKTYQVNEFNESDVPVYAVLSHTYVGKDGDNELCTRHLGPVDNSDQIVLARKESTKIKNFCRLAQLDGIQWLWIDICCLDRSNSAELSEALNSQYKWIENAAVCYVYLSDVSNSVDHVQRTLRDCRWFTRKWTLQELVAPASVKFFAANWTLIGTRSGLHSIISEITGIQSAVLKGEKKPKQCHVSERMGWTSNRTTLVVEDEAYSMLGLFDIQMPILYGEGSRAFRRLQDEIRRTHYSSVLDTARAGMRLLLTNSDPLEIKSFAASDSPEYAILSHTWGSSDDEVSFLDVSQGIAKSKRLYGKIKSSCDLAASHGFEYLWVDTCCIDKTSSAELQEAICSMYRWYKCAQICYVYLEDCLVSPGSPSLWHSRWFTRGWTLRKYFILRTTD